MKKGQRILSILLAMVMCIGILAACSNNADTAKETTASKETNAQDQTTAAKQGDDGYWSLLDKVTDASELPAWSGKQLKIREWRGHGAGNDTQYKADNDVVTPEYTRISGVTVDLENSFDNAGTDFETKLGVLAASNDWPEVVRNPNALKKLVDADLLYDLTDLIPQYMPNLMKKVAKDGPLAAVWTNDVKVTGGRPGKAYVVPFGCSVPNYADLQPDLDPVRWARIQGYNDYAQYARIWVRDDILKKLYPNAMTVTEMEDIYLQFGSFTEEQIFDVPIKSREEFVKFLYDIKALIEKEGLKEGNKKVEVTNSGFVGDYWPTLAAFDGMLDGRGPSNNYGTYFNNETKKVDFMGKQPWFKENLKMFNKLVNDGIIAKESFVDSQAILQEKLNSGLYAVNFIPWVIPDRKVLEEKGKTYKYRRINLQIPFDSKRFALLRTPPAPGGQVGIFKSKVKEEDLPQLLRYYDFQMSDVGTRLSYWGPKTAGLWVEDGEFRTFTNKDLEENLIYGKDNGAALKYGLIGDPFGKTQYPFFTAYAISDVNSPKYMYKEVRRSRFDAENALSAAKLSGKGYMYDELAISANQSADFWMYANGVTKAGEKFQAVWTAYNDMMGKIMVAKTEADFEASYKAAVEFAEKNGLDQAGLDEINAVFAKMNEGQIK